MEPTKAPSSTLRLTHLMGGFAIGVGLGTVGLAALIVSHPAITFEFASVTALIGLFCTILGWTCMRGLDPISTAAASEEPNLNDMASA